MKRITSLLLMLAAGLSMLAMAGCGKKAAEEPPITPLRPDQVQRGIPAGSPSVAPSNAPAASGVTHPPATGPTSGK